MLLLLPLITILIVSYFWLRKKAKLEKETQTGGSAILGIILIILDLFYSSLIWWKEDLKGRIIDLGWLKIDKIISETEKKDWLLQIKEKNNISEELWEKLSNINIQECKNYNKILLALEEKINLMLNPAIEKKFGIRIWEWVQNNPTIIIGSIVLSV